MENIETYCRSCSHESNHSIIAKHEHIENDRLIKNEEEFFNHMITQCLGCDTIGYLTTSWHLSDKNEDGSIYKSEYHYPHDPEQWENDEFLSDDEHSHLPRSLYDLYEELRNAIRMGSNLLAGIGLRMMVEAVCLHQKVTGRNLRAKIDKIFDNGLISKNELEVLHKLREIGKMTTHQIKSPSKAVLDAAREAINHLLRSIYVVRMKTKRLNR